MKLFLGVFLALTTSLFQFTQADNTLDQISLSYNYNYTNQVASKQLLSNESFGNSWNHPSNKPYSPPNQSFNRVVLELSVNTTGNNYDRLGQLFIDNTEIWRTSTPEPDNAGPYWNVRKDVSAYASLFKSNRTINFEIQSALGGPSTGIFYVTLTAYFYNDSSSEPVTSDNWALDYNDPPSSIEALMPLGSGFQQSWSTPTDNVTRSVGPLDRSTNRALLHIFASGNLDDEFWWDASSNAGPSRFIDVYVGGQSAGFVAPYPVIFTGGINPLLWRPLVDIRAFDIPAYFIDITPFLPILWDQQTEIELRVTDGINSDQTPTNWIISYNLFTWSTKGQNNSGTTNKPLINSSNNGGGSSVVVDRNITTSASLNIGGQQKNVQWTQEASFNNTQYGGGIVQDTVGTSSVSGLYDFSLDFDFPLKSVSNSSYVAIHQGLKSDANGQTYRTHLDTAVTLNNGNYVNSSSSQWLTYPGGKHYAATVNGGITEKY